MKIDIDKTISETLNSLTESFVNLGTQKTAGDNHINCIWPYDHLGIGLGSRVKTQAPAFDFGESDDCYLITADLPGYTAANLEVSYENERITISGSRSFGKHRMIATHTITERVTLDVSRVFYVPNIDESHIACSLKDGILAIELPKLPKQSKKIKIEIK